MVIVVVKDTNGNIVLTEEEFRKYLEEARQEGYSQGLAACSKPYIYWWNWGTSTPITCDATKITCKCGEGSGSIHVTGDTQLQNSINNFIK